MASYFAYYLSGDIILPEGKEFNIILDFSYGLNIMKKRTETICSFRDVYRKKVTFLEMSPFTGRYI
jgi:hypothetical protein